MAGSLDRGHVQRLQPLVLDAGVVRGMLGAAMNTRHDPVKMSWNIWLFVLLLGATVHLRGADGPVGANTLGSEN